MRPPAPPLPVTLIPGDGIGPEITAVLVRVFDALGRPFLWEEAAMGLEAYEQFGDPLPAETLASLTSTGLAIKGPVQTPLASGFRSPLIHLRQEFGLFANLRPARTLLAEATDRGIDMIIVRENTEGLYAAQESFIPSADDTRGIAVALCWNSRLACERILGFAFDYAVRHRRRKVTVVHKANVLKILSGIFLETARSLYSDRYANAFELEEMIVDACAMNMAMRPERFDVIVTTNMFGDILSDLAAGVTGGLGLAPGANFGARLALFEAVHGSAPDIAGQGTANPVALLMSGALLLDYLGRDALASRLRRAIDAALNQDRVRTPDLGGSASTQAVADAIIARLT